MLVDDIVAEVRKGVSVHLYGARYAGKSYTLGKVRAIMEVPMINGIDSPKQILLDLHQLAKATPAELAALPIPPTIIIDNADRMTGRKAAYLSEWLMSATLLTSGRKPLPPPHNNMQMPPLSREEAMELAKKELSASGNSGKVSPRQICDFSTLPGYILLCARSGKAPRDNPGVAFQLDIAPLVFVLVAGLVLFRVIGREADAGDLVVLGGASAVVLIIMRTLIK